MPKPRLGRPLAADPESARGAKSVLASSAGDLPRTNNGGPDRDQTTVSNAARLCFRLSFPVPLPAALITSESFYSRFRDECFNREQIWTLTEAL